MLIVASGVPALVSWQAAHPSSESIGSTERMTGSPLKSSSCTNPFWVRRTMRSIESMAGFTALLDHFRRKDPEFPEVLDAVHLVEQRFDLGDALAHRGRDRPHEDLAGLMHRVARLGHHVRLLRHPEDDEHCEQDHGQYRGHDQADALRD